MSDATRRPGGTRCVRRGFSAASRRGSRCAAALLFAAVAVGCGKSTTAPSRGTSSDQQFSFESGLEGWTVGAADTLVGPGDPIAWSVQPSDRQAFDGRRSVEFYMANRTDAAKLWIVRPIEVAPGRAYHVTITYELGTSDWGDANHFSLITGVVSAPPRTAAGLPGTFPNNMTGNGASSDVGYRWVAKRVEVDATPDAAGHLYPVVGVWGTYEVARTYYVDSLRVQVVPR